jgi:opacity protein-like surface antigen
MKKILISLVTANAVLMAGGDFVTPEEPVIEIPEIDNSAFYLGLGLGQSSVNDDPTQEEITSTSLTLQAGYQYNEYIAVEGRASFGFNSEYEPGLTTNTGGDFDDDIFSWGIYLKPMYPVTEEFSLYALLGYGGVQLGNLESGDAYESGFHWGLGASYAATETISVFVDYVQLYDDTGFDYRAQLEEVDADAWTLGVSYKF